MKKKAKKGSRTRKTRTLKITIDKLDAESAIDILCFIFEQAKAKKIKKVLNWKPKFKVKICP